MAFYILIPEKFYQQIPSSATGIGAIFKKENSIYMNISLDKGKSLLPNKPEDEDTILKLCQKTEAPSIFESEDSKGSLVCKITTLQEDIRDTIANMQKIMENDYNLGPIWALNSCVTYIEFLRKGFSLLKKRKNQIFKGIIS